LAEIQKSLADTSADPSLDFAQSFHAAEFPPMNYLISLGIGLGVGLLYGALDFRSPAPPAIALVGLLGMLAGEQLWPMGRQLVAGWLS
jgi:XapX domain-containing protein